MIDYPWDIGLPYDTPMVVLDERLLCEVLHKKDFIDRCGQSIDMGLSVSDNSIIIMPSEAAAWLRIEVVQCRIRTVAIGTISHMHDTDLESKFMSHGSTSFRNPSNIKNMYADLDRPPAVMGLLLLQ